MDQVARDPNLGDRRIAPPDLGFRTRRGGWGMTESNGIQIRFGDDMKQEHSMRQLVLASGGQEASQPPIDPIQCVTDSRRLEQPFSLHLLTFAYKSLS